MRTNVGSGRALLVIGTTTIIRDGPRFTRSAETTTAGRWRPCSCPRTGSRSMCQTSPRLGFSAMPFLQPVWQRQVPFRKLHLEFAPILGAAVQLCVSCIKLVKKKLPALLLDRLIEHLLH